MKHWADTSYNKKDIDFNTFHFSRELYFMKEKDLLDKEMDYSVIKVPHQEIENFNFNI